MINEFVKPGHFYSVIPNITKEYNNNKPKFLDIDFNDNMHIKILDEINNYLKPFDEKFGINNTKDIKNIVLKRQSDFEYSLMNGAFEWMDSRLLFYFLQKNKPKKIIEIGCGNSTLLTYNTKKMFNLDIEIICIEPYPSDYLKKMHSQNKILLINDKLENIDLEIFKNLTCDDILFIDSTHVVKLDSDVMYYFTKILPLLNKGVLVHIHDIFFPFDYPMEWSKQGIFWNEQYFLYIFLLYNTKFKIHYCNSYSIFKFKDKLLELQKEYYEFKNNFAHHAFGGGSIWLLVCE